MRLSHSQVLAAPIDHVWANFMDLEVVGRCFPGATVTEVEGDDFVGNIRSRLGPLTVWFDGEGSLTERRTDGHRAKIEATGQERHGLGKATIAVAVVLSQAEGHTEERPATRARMTTDLQFYGAALEVGKGLVQRASDPLVERFLHRMASPDAATAPGEDDGDAVDLWRSATDLLGSFTGRRRRRS
ncbi:carbon monoxide dehydrogenase subunit G [Humibacillus xanthopallidus]|uniref:Carbon monoxide dehydrogenase subunit G n=1 Tax=Humibacillus xanthopallidus TaxID=412689 RepID=A0A543PNW8_9MICO|nr:SRPBCC domain-containing protein [Humibacillus xanthopallidus]TQN45750.1 carbon monoxide dehydrogenase subunit G [Humibacillus xanthopallidus]